MKLILPPFNCISRTSSVPCDRGVGKGVREADRRARQREDNLCLYQASSRGGGYNLARFGSPELGLLYQQYFSFVFTRHAGGVYHSKQSQKGLFFCFSCSLAYRICGVKYRLVSRAILELKKKQNKRKHTHKKKTHTHIHTNKLQKQKNQTPFILKTGLEACFIFYMTE